MPQVRFSLAHSKSSREASKKLPYSVWHAILQERGRKPDTVAAWVAHGTPVTPSRADAARADTFPADTDGDPLTPTFTIYSEAEPLRPMCVIQADDSAGAGAESYSVIDDRGQVLARISKSRSPLGLRRAWRIEPTGSGNPLVGYRGTLRSWLLFIVFLPLWLPLTLVTIVVIKLDLDTGDEFTWEPPQRTVWRSRPRDLLASAALDSRLSAYRWTPTELDARIAYAQAVLHRVC